MEIVNSVSKPVFTRSKQVNSYKTDRFGNIYKFFFILGQVGDAEQLYLHVLKSFLYNLPVTKQYSS